MSDQRIGKHEENLDADADNHDDEDENHFHAKERAHEPRHIFGTRVRLSGHLRHHGGEHDEVERHHDNKDSDHLDCRDDQTGHEVVESLEHQSKFKGPVSQPFQQAEKQAHHHRAHQDYGNKS